MSVLFGHKLPPVEGVGSGKKATLRVPIGPTYDRFKIAYSGVTLEQIKNLELKISKGAGSRTVVHFDSAADLHSFNEFNLRHDGASAGLLHWWFKLPEAPA